MTVSRCPGHLKGVAKRFFTKCVKEFELDGADHDLLVAACEQLQRAEQCRKAIDKQGVSMLDRFGQPRANPLLSEERSCINQFRLCYRELGLSGPAEEPRMPLPPNYR